MRDRFLVAPARPGKIVGARLVYKNGNYRLFVTLSWKQGEFTVTGYDNYEVREWRTADQALKRLYELIRLHRNRSRRTRSREQVRALRPSASHRTSGPP